MMPDIETIYLQYYSKVMGYIHSRIRNRADAEDICSDVFEKVQRKLPEFDPAAAGLEGIIRVVRVRGCRLWYDMLGEHILMAAAGDGGQEAP